MFSWHLLRLGFAILLAGALASLALGAPGGQTLVSAPPILMSAATPIVREFVVVTNTSLQHLPDISGNTVVWRDYRNGNPDIYAKDVRSVVDFPITTNPFMQDQPAISGNWAVWADTRVGNWDIYGMDLTYRVDFPITRHAATQDQPAISGNKVVWRDFRNGIKGDIYGWDLSTMTEFVVSTQPAEQQNPAISGNIVVWEDDRDGLWHIYGKDLAIGREFAVVTNTSFAQRPAISGNIVVWMDWRNNNGDIYGKNLATGQEFPIVTNASTQDWPAISDNIVVWEDQRHGECCSIYGKDLTTGMEFPIAVNVGGQRMPAISGNIVVWEDYRHGNPDIYGARLEPPLAVGDVQANPNPFNPATGTTISYTLTKAAYVILVVLDGHLSPVRVTEGMTRPGGPGAVLWDGRDQMGQVISSGLYVLIVTARYMYEEAYGYTSAAADDGVAPAITNVVADPPNIVPPGGTEVFYQVSKGSVQVLLVLNATGTEVRRDIYGYIRRGLGSVYWDGKNNAGSYVPNGNYILVPVAVDLLGRVGWNYTVVRVGNVAAIPIAEAQKVASAWVEKHRSELARLLPSAMDAKLKSLP